MLDINKKINGKKHSTDIVIWSVFVAVAITLTFFIVKVVSTLKEQDLTNVTINPTEIIATSRNVTDEDVSVMIIPAQE